MRSTFALLVGLPIQLLLASPVPGASPAPAPNDRVIGLLAIPEVFGTGPCSEFVPQDVALHAAPGGTVIGALRVAANWTFNPEGGCEGLEVMASLFGKPEAAVPVEEFEYEAVAAVVIEQNGPWFRLRLDGESAWVRATARDTFHPLEHLYKDRLTYLTDDWDRRLADRPGHALRAPRTQLDDHDHPVRVTGSARVGQQLWFHVELLSHSGCEGEDEPEVTERGWVPAHAQSGKRSIWFYSRGC